MQRVGASDDVDDIVLAPDPRYAAPVAEHRRESHLQRNFSRQPLDNADDVAPLVTRRHEVDNADFPAITLEVGFENQCVPSVTLLVPADSRRRANRPPAVLIPP